MRAKFIIIAILLLILAAHCQGTWQASSPMQPMADANAQIGSSPQTDAQLWYKSIIKDARKAMRLHYVDSMIFIVSCPVLLVLQVTIIIMFSKNTSLLTKPGNVFLALVSIEIVLNLHLISTAIDHFVNPGDEMPANFPVACSGLGYIQVLFEINHFSYLFIFLFYIVFLIRYTLKKKTNTFWSLFHAVAFFFCLFITTYLYLESFIGLNYFGICGISSLYKKKEQTNWDIGIPLFGISSTVLFFLLGLFTQRYYKKHMPEGPFKLRKTEYNRIISLFVIGFTLCELTPNVFVLVIAIEQERPKVEDLYFLIMISNIVRIAEYYFTIFLIVWNDKFRHGLKGMMKKLFMMLSGRSELGNDVTSLKSNFEMEEIVVNEKLLQIKDRSNEIDLLFISQIFTIISGIYAVFFEYFQVDHSDQSTHQEIKSLGFKESITIEIDNESIKNYEFETRIMLKLQILRCKLTFFCPKYFYKMLQRDRLDPVHLSFKIMENVKKICSVADGQGGKSGEFFFFSADRKFIVKTITQEEFSFLKCHLVNFSEHYKSNPKSLITKIYGLMIFKGDQIQRTYRLIVMKNITGCPQSQILRVYDLKGSKHNREVVKKKKTQANELESKTLKDIDFIKYEGKIKIHQELAEEARRVIKKDVEFLRDLNLIDYSFLVVRIKWEEKPLSPWFWGELERIAHSENSKEYYHVGIIDYLQPWDFQKKSERWWKKLTGKTEISAINPRSYCTRFLTFLDQISVSSPSKPRQTDIQAKAQNELQFAILKARQQSTSQRGVEDQSQSSEEYEGRHSQMQEQ